MTCTEDSLEIGDDVLADSVGEVLLAGVLVQDKQKEKILALDAMNDLRPDTEWPAIPGEPDSFLPTGIPIRKATV